MKDAEFYERLEQAIKDAMAHSILADWGYYWECSFCSESSRGLHDVVEHDHDCEGAALLLEIRKRIQ